MEIYISVQLHGGTFLQKFLYVWLWLHSSVIFPFECKCLHLAFGILTLNMHAVQLKPIVLPDNGCRVMLPYIDYHYCEIAIYVYINIKYMYPYSF